jgi:hypothetical protein
MLGDKNGRQSREVKETSQTTLRKQTNYSARFVVAQRATPNRSIPETAKENVSLSRLAAAK